MLIVETILKGMHLAYSLQSHRSFSLAQILGLPTNKDFIHHYTCQPHNSSAYVLRSFLMSSCIWLQHIHYAFHKRESHTNPLENELPGRYNCDRGIYLCVIH